MRESVTQKIRMFFRGLTLTDSEAEGDIRELLSRGEVEEAVSLMQDREDEVDNAISEYNPQTHRVMKRPNKYRSKNAPYRTEKLPRTRQRYINEVELFFLLGRPVQWHKRDGEDEDFRLFMEFLEETHFDDTMRAAKRLAGAETESAKLYHIYRQGDEAKVRSVVLARSTRYKLRPMFDQYGGLTAFAYGYTLREPKGQKVEHWDIQTAETLYYCRRGKLRWEVTAYPNPTGRINVIYYRQPKAWDGVEPRIDREEMLDSKIADTNNYFADPIAAATADVIDSMTDPNKPGKLIQLAGDGSRFEYVNPPQSSETRSAEQEALERSILFDTLTPDLSFDNLKGMGTLSGAAIRNAMILGYIKRENRMEIYGGLLRREVSVIIGILKMLHPERAASLDTLRVSFEFAEPFEEDKRAEWESVSALYQGGVLSLEEAVKLLGVAEKPEEEIARLRAAAETHSEGEGAP